MTDQLIARAEQHDYQKLFIQDLNWSRPDHAPVTYSEDGHTLTATNVSSYKGLRVWVVDQAPHSKLEAALDQLIAKSSTDRLVIFHDDTEQVWRWPVRRATGNTTATRLSRHRHRTGDPDPRFAAKLDAIRLPLDKTLDPNAVLAKVREAFDVEAKNETKHASKLMARLYRAMEKAYPASIDRKTREHQISVTLARILFLMFGDDTDMWPQDLFRAFIHEHTAPDGSDIGARLTALFAYLDTSPTERAKPAAELDGFRYVNGGIFRERITLPVINAEFRSVVLEACDRDWATISPAIFGSMFQSVRDAKPGASSASTTPPRRTSSRHSTRSSSTNSVPSSSTSRPSASMKPIGCASFATISGTSVTWIPPAAAATSSSSPTASYATSSWPSWSASKRSPAMARCCWRTSVSRSRSTTSTV